MNKFFLLLEKVVMRGKSEGEEAAEILSDLCGVDLDLKCLKFSEDCELIVSVSSYVGIFGNDCYFP